MALLVVIPTINPIRMNLPVLTDKEVRDVDFSVFIALDLVADFDPGVAVVMWEDCDGKV